MMPQNPQSRFGWSANIPLPRRKYEMAAVIATWPFGLDGAKAAAQLLRDHASALEAVTIGIETVELDPTVTSAGYGGLPNADGVLQLDAALMTSAGRAGAVIAVENFPSAIGLARLVMQHSSHTILTGAGAMRFAVECGLQTCSDASELLTAHAKKRYEEFREGLGHTDGRRDGERIMKHRYYWNDCKGCDRKSCSRMHDEWDGVQGDGACGGFAHHWGWTLYG